ncbi:CHASE2 domain-containing sensor protein [Sinorhizobium medicae]
MASGQDGFFAAMATASGAKGAAMTRTQLFGVIVGLVIVAALTTLRASDPPLLRLARDLTFDEYQRLAPRSFENVPVRVVDIDEASLSEFGQWPWPRDRIAALVDRLSELGAAVIAFDILFSEPDRLSPRSVMRDVAGVDPDLLGLLPDNDEIFARSIADRPVVLGFGLSNAGDYRPPVKAGFAFTGESPFDAPAATDGRDAFEVATRNQCCRIRTYQSQSREPVRGRARRPAAVE